MSFLSKLIFEFKTTSSQVTKTSVCSVPELGTGRRADDFDGGGFSENGLHSAFSTTDGLDKLQQGCERKAARLTLSKPHCMVHFSREWKKQVWCAFGAVVCVCVRVRGMQVFACVCVCIILLVCLYDCEHEKCTACRNLLGGLCDDGTIKVSTVNTPV